MIPRARPTWTPLAMAYLRKLNQQGFVRWTDAGISSKVVLRERKKIPFSYKKQSILWVVSWLRFLFLLQQLTFVPNYFDSLDHRLRSPRNHQTTLYCVGFIRALSCRLLSLRTTSIIPSRRRKWAKERSQNHHNIRSSRDSRKTFSTFFSVLKQISDFLSVF